MTGLARLATDIYFDQARRLGNEPVHNAPQLKAVVEGIAGDAFEPLPDPAATVVAARLLHDLITTRRYEPLERGSAWVFIETYLLLHDCAMAARDDEAASLTALLHQGRIDAASTLQRLTALAGPPACPCGRVPTRPLVYPL